MSLATLYAIDVVAICALVFAIYLPRHHRKDLMLAFIGVNIGVLGVTQALASAEVTAGLGLGLFGVLSIIRLRSAEMEAGFRCHQLGSARSSCSASCWRSSWPTTPGCSVLAVIRS